MLGLACQHLRGRVDLTNKRPQDIAFVLQQLSRSCQNEHSVIVRGGHLFDNGPDTGKYVPTFSTLSGPLRSVQFVCGALIG